MLRKTSTSTRILQKVLFYRAPRGGGFGPGGLDVGAPKNVDLNKDGAQPSAELCDPNADWARRVHQNSVLSDRGARSPLGSTLRFLKISTLTEMSHFGRSKHRSGAQPSAELFDPNADRARRLHQNGVLSDRGASSPLGSTLRFLKISTLTRIWSLGCSEHRSGIVLVVWFVDLNKDLALQMFKPLFWNTSCAKAASVAVLAFCLLVV